MGRKRKDYTGEVFGLLTVTGDAPIRGDSSRYLYCTCECGNTIEMHLSNLKKEIQTTKSCGCVGKHGGTGTRLHRIWQNMKQRCYNQKNTGYANYGGQGITICADWVDSFVAFREWSTENGYNDTLTIDRIDGYGNYEPSNCRWTTQEIQMRNQKAQAGTSSCFIGVCFFKRTGRWAAYVSVTGVRKHLGFHDTAEEAARCRDSYITDNNLIGFQMNTGI